MQPQAPILSTGTLRLIEGLPGEEGPEVFGLHRTSVQGHQQRRSQGLLERLLAVQPRLAAAGLCPSPSLSWIGNCPVGWPIKQTGVEREGPLGKARRAVSRPRLSSPCSLVRSEGPQQRVGTPSPEKVREAGKPRNPQRLLFSRYERSDWWSGRWAVASPRVQVGHY